MYEDMISGFVNDVINAEKEEVTVSKEFLVSLYAAALQSALIRDIKVLESDVWKSVPYIEVTERFFLGDDEGRFIEFDVVYSNNGGITAISAVVGNNNDDWISAVFTD